MILRLGIKKCLLCNLVFLRCFGCLSTELLYCTISRSLKLCPPLCSLNLFMTPTEQMNAPPTCRRHFIWAPDSTALMVAQQKGIPSDLVMLTTYSGFTHVTCMAARVVQRHRHFMCPHMVPLCGSTITSRGGYLCNTASDGT